MRKYLLVTIFLSVSTWVWCQQPKVYPGKEAGQHVNESIYLADTVKGFKIINKHLKLLDLGGKHPKQKVTVVLKGDDIKLDPAHLIGHLVIVHGTVALYKRKPQITVIDSTAIKIQKTPTD